MVDFSQTSAFYRTSPIRRTNKACDTRFTPAEVASDSCGRIAQTLRSSLTTPAHSNKPYSKETMVDFPLGMLS